MILSFFLFLFFDQPKKKFHGLRQERAHASHQAMMRENIKGARRGTKNGANIRAAGVHTISLAGLMNVSSLTSNPKYNKAAFLIF